MIRIPRARHAHDSTRFALISGFTQPAVPQLFLVKLIVGVIQYSPAFCLPFENPTAMHRSAPFPVQLLTIAIISLALVDDSPAADSKIDFAGQIKPLLSDRCFLCHGPDSEARESNLRLDSKDGVLAALESDSDRHAVVPGDPAASELVTRILAEDADVRMPPADSGLTLNAEEKDLLRRWVAEGAEWKGHWSFEPIRKPEPPAVKNTQWCRNPIDAFIVSRLEAVGDSPGKMEKQERLLRRVTFDLTGLPPTLSDIDAFVNDTAADAFEKVVDRLLVSERFGERMTADWLDVARYSDTYGYQVDRDRFVWPWRDWVINAFNFNMPYDRFVTEQLAGDLLPNATKDQILATTFNRLHPQKVEGGSVPEEFRVEYVADRSQTVATAFLGLTMECCRCHDHKYDPLLQREYYQLYSFFNNIDEAGLYSYFTSSVPTPTLPLPTDQQKTKIATAEQEVLAAELRVRQLAGKSNVADAATILQQRIANPTATDAPLIPGQVAELNFDEGTFSENTLVDSPHGKAIRLTGDHSVDVKVGNFPRWQPFTVSTWLQTPTAFERCVVFHRSRAWTDAASRGYELLIEGGHLSAALIHFWPGNALRIRSVAPLTVDKWQQVTMTYDGSSKAAGLKLWLDGKPLATEIVRDNLTRNITGGGGDTINIGERFRDKGFANGLVDEFRVFDRELTALEVEFLFHQPAVTDISPALISTYIAATADTEFQSAVKERQSAREKLFKLQDGLQEIMVMQEGPQRRQAYVLTRGAYDAHGEEVPSGVPASLPSMTDKMPKNRLGLAQWMTSPDNPLTARVAVNRLWQMCFEHGIVRTPEDFGSQGASPTHPELLDWLAADFRENGWNVKRQLKQIVMSSTYRQSSAETPEQHRRDPENLLLSHAPVFRLSAEMLRDNALAVSGLLQSTIGGAPVRPYELAASFKPSTPDQGAGLYRRSLYTYWKRTAPAPMMMTLDASKREVCRLKRERTASPLQSLVIMNGPQFVEASRVLAQQMLTDHGDDDNVMLSTMFRLLTTRLPTEANLATILTLFQQQRQHFTKQPEAAAKYLAVGDSKTETKHPAKLAALTSVANMLFALDECMMRR